MYTLTFTSITQLDTLTVILLTYVFISHLPWSRLIWMKSVLIYQ